jgi:hypothetical protein
VEIKASLVLADDAMGGWTNRYLTEASARFQNKGVARRPFACGLLWTSESPTTAQIREELLATIYRTAYQLRRGLPKTLREMLAQEGLAASFASATPALPPDAIDRARTVIAPHLDASASAHYPTVFSCLYGDDAATAVGYATLGLPPRAGFEVALADAPADARVPVGVL